MTKTKLIVCILVVIGLAGGATWFFSLNKEPEVTKNTPQKTDAENTKHSDTTSPTIKIQDSGLSSEPGLTGTVVISVDARDDAAVSKVEYYIDGTFFDVTYTQPFSLQLDTSRLSAGDHTLLAKAYDAAGNHSDSQTVTIVIAANEQPTPEPATHSPVSRVPSPNVTVGSTNTSGGSNSTPSSPPDAQSPLAPSNVTLSAPNDYATTAMWTASSGDASADGYRVYRDDSLIGTVTTTSYTDYTVVPGNTYAYSVVAYNDAGDSTTSSEPSITLGTTSIWDDFDTPEVFGNDGSPLELGVKFKPKVDGKISGIRFYKASGDLGTHTGRLWASNGTPISNVTFINETASGWQQAVFSAPVDVTANTTYVASYTTPTGAYGATGDYFELAGIDNEYLMAPRSGSADGSNGVFSTTPGAFPTSMFDETNYWVDVLFTPNPDAGGPSAPTPPDPSQIFPGFPGSDNTGVVGMRLPRRDRVDPVANMTITGVDIRSDFISITAPNVTFDHTKLTYIGPVDGSFTLVNIQVGISGTTFLDCEVDGRDAVERALYGTTDIVVRRSNIHNTANAVEVSNHITATDNYVHNIFTPDGQIWHADGFQIANTADNLNVTHNTIFITGSETGAVNFVGRPGMGDSLTNVLVENNLMAGGSYTVYVGAETNTNVRVLNNKLSTRYYPKVGAFNIYYPTFIAGVVVSGNTIYETGASADVNLP